MKQFPKQQEMPMRAARRPLSLVLLILLPAWGHAATPQENWAEHCASCHGANGDGRTKEGLKLRTKDYTDPKVQEEFSDIGLLKNLMLGVGGEGNKERMPRFSAKLTPAEAKELIALIRSFKR